MRTRLTLLAMAAALSATIAAQTPAPAPAQGRGAAPAPAAGAPAPGQRGGGQRDPNAAPGVQGQNINGMHIYIRAGLKSHGEGKHDYPQFLADWSKLLTVKYGAVVDGSYHSPTAAELAKTDVVVMYKGDAGYMTPLEKADL